MLFRLSGTLPFNSIDISAILTKTMEGGFTINGPKWKDISADAKDLIQKLLEGDPLSRLSLSDALKHKWFKILGE